MIITRKTSILEALQAYPESKEVFARHAMDCAGCMGAIHETIESGARMHGIDLTVLLKELNALGRGVS